MVHLRRSAGVTLIELLVVIGIVAVLAVALGFTYQGWVGNYRIESQAKQFYSDLMEARTSALTRSFPYLVSMTATQYQIVEDSNNSGQIEASDRRVWPNPKALEYGHQFKMFSGGAFPADATPLVINSRGLAAVGAAPWYVGIDSTGFTPDYDCVIIMQARIALGKWNGGAGCVEK